MTQFPYLLNGDNTYTLTIRRANQANTDNAYNSGWHIAFFKVKTLYKELKFKATMKYIFKPIMLAKISTLRHFTIWVCKLITFWGKS